MKPWNPQILNKYDLIHTFFLILSVNMVKIKLALCQMNVVDNKDENIKKASLMIKKSVDQKADFITLPEMFNCPYSNDKFIEYMEKIAARASEHEARARDNIWKEQWIETLF